MCWWRSWSFDLFREKCHPYCNNTNVMISVKKKKPFFTSPEINTRSSFIFVGLSNESFLLIASPCEYLIYIFFKWCSCPTPHKKNSFWALQFYKYSLQPEVSALNNWNQKKSKNIFMTKILTIKYLPQPTKRQVDWEGNGEEAMVWKVFIKMC